MTRCSLLCLLLCAAEAAACSDGTAPPPPPPVVTVTGVSPNSGPLAGGTAVTITGTNFPTTLDSVWVGTGRLASLVRVSATQLTGTTPAGAAPGAVDVTVPTASAGTGTCMGCFTYNPRVAVDSIGPNRGPLAGGTAVTISGTNFPITLDSVRVGRGRLATLVRVSATQLTGTTPAGAAAGAVDVTVYTTAAGNATCTGCFAYNPITPVQWASLTAGGSHTCGLTTGGVAYCWGWNEYGQLGTSASIPQCTYGSGRATGVGPCSAVPVAVAGGIALASLIAGASYTCGLTSSGTAYCWGQNSAGQLGDSSTTDRATPVAVAGGITFTTLTAGYDHTCGVTTGGAAYCWGNNNGDLGDGSTTNRTTPVPISGGLTFTSLTAGSAFTCGVTTGGAAYCWGGDGSVTPVPITGGLTFASLTAGSSHVCGVASDSITYCWGDNYFGQFGNGSSTWTTTPVPAAGGLTFTSVTAGSYHTCALTTGGVAYCWGSIFEWGGAYLTLSLTPWAVQGQLTFTSLTAGGGHTCALTAGGAAYCWGYNGFGQLGNGTKTSGLTPVAVVSP